MTKVIFGGAYGLRSQGDDAALLALTEGLRQRTESLEGVVIARHTQEDLYKPYGLRSLKNFEYENKAESLGKWFYGFNYEDERQHLYRLQKEIGGSDLLIYGAGNALNDTTIDLLRGPIPYMAILTLMAKMTGTPVMLFGISIGPLRTEYGRNLSRVILNLAEVVTVRDQESVSELHQLDYQGAFIKLPDPVLGLKPPPAGVAQAIPSWCEAHRRPGRVFAVSVRNVAPPEAREHHRYFEAMTAVCDRLVSDYQASLLFIPQCTYQHGNPLEDDRQVARLIVDRMRHKDKAVLAEEDLTVEQCLGLYGETELALGTRLHANVFAAIQGVPAIAVSYHHKVQGFMEWLGCGHLALSLSAFEPEAALKKVESALANRERLSRAILSRVAAGRRETEPYADLAWDLIRKPGRLPWGAADRQVLKEASGATI